MTSYSILGKVKKFYGGCSMRGKVKIGEEEGSRDFFFAVEKYNLYYSSRLAARRYY